jgi:predicted esterase
MIRALICTSALLAFLGSAALDQKPGKEKSGGSQKKEAPAKEDPDAVNPPELADIPTQDLHLGKDENKRYLLDGPRKNEKEPKDGFGLLVVMPGGAGTVEFHRFVKNVYKNAVPDGFLLAQPVPPKWTANPSVIWPTEKIRGDGMKFTTEEFVEGVIEEVGKARKIDPARVYTLTWSSSGPAAYVISTRKKELVKGSLIAMSVFQPDFVESERVKGKAYYILHSPEDKTCAFEMAEQARDFLLKKGAQVAFATYAGGHGWTEDPFGNIRKGLEWLENPKEPKEKPGEKSGKKPERK